MSLKFVCFVTFLLFNVSSLYAEVNNNDLEGRSGEDASEEYGGGSNGNKERTFFGSDEGILSGGGSAGVTTYPARFPLFQRFFGGGNRGFNGQVQGYFYKGPTAQQGSDFNRLAFNPYFAGQGYGGLTGAGGMYPYGYGMSQYGFPNYYGYGYPYGNYQQ